MRLNEIESIFKGDYNPGLKTFSISEKFADIAKSKMKPLPGNDRYTYVIGDLDPYGSIYVFDPNDLSYFVGKLDLSSFTVFKNTLRVMSIMVHPKYRGQGIAKSLYKLVLMPKPYGLGMILMSDDIQTPGGKRNWVSISQIPGMEVTGLIKISKNLEHPDEDVEDDSVKIITDLIGKVGGVYYADNKFSYYFQIPVNVSPTRLENSIKSSLIKIYPNDLFKAGEFYTSYLMAKYVGGK